jgi:hypothetical protein
MASIGAAVVEKRSCAADLLAKRSLVVAKVRIVVEVLRGRIPLRADTGAGVAAALGSLGAGIWISRVR